MAEPHKIAGSTIPERKTWHADTQREVTAAPSGTWRERLQPWEIALCEAAMASRLRGSATRSPAAVAGFRPAISPVMPAQPRCTGVRPISAGCATGCGGLRTRAGGVPALRGR